MTTTIREMTVVELPDLREIDQKLAKILMRINRPLFHRGRVLLTMFFLHDGGRLDLEQIEEAHTRVFPPSARGKEPADYVDFQATTIRNPLGRERWAGWWEGNGWGGWWLTNEGRDEALRLLDQLGVLVVLRGELLRVGQVAGRAA